MFLEEGGAITSDQPGHDLEQIHAEGRLVQWLADFCAEKPESDRNALFDQILELNRRGRVDLLTLLLNPPELKDWTENFPARVILYRGLISRLDEPVDRMVDVLGASSDGGLDYVIVEAFHDWCVAAPARVGQLIGLLDKGHQVADRMVLPALAAGLKADPGQYLGLTSAMATGTRPVLALAAVMAMAVMSVTDPLHTLSALAVLEAVIKNGNREGELRPAALRAAVDIASRAPNEATDRVVIMIGSAGAGTDTALLHASAESFAIHGGSLPEPILEALEQALPRIGPLSTAGSIGHGLYRLLNPPGGHQEERALRMIEDLLTAPGTRITLKQLGGVSHELANGDAARLSRVVVRWIASGKQILGDSALYLVQQIHGRESLLEAPAANLNGSERLFLARKAIGFLFVKPIAAVSLIISMITDGDEATNEGLGDLLFDPLLSSYPGSVKRHLSFVAQSAQGATAKALDRVLSKHELYIKGVEATGSIPELYPSERNQRIQHQRQQDQFLEIRRQAESQSSLLAIIPKTIILHGRRTVSYVEDFGGGVRRLDNKLNSFGTEFEHAMQLVFDPIGLENMIMAFRLERSSE